MIEVVWTGVRLKEKEDLFKVNYSYIAGIVDGEGTIGFSNRKSTGTVTPYLSIANSNLELIRTIKLFLANKDINSVICKKKPTKSNHKIGYTLSFRFNHAIKLTNLIKDELIIKKEQAMILTIDYVNSTRRNGKYTISELESRTILLNRMSSLNSRGVAKSTHDNSL